MRQKKGLLLFIAALALLFLAGCGVDEIDVSAYEDQKIELTGLDDGTEWVTIGELKALDCITKKTHSTSDKIGEVRATGPLLETLLQAHGASQTDFSKIRIYGRDNYDISLSEKVLEEDDVILAFGIDGEPLDAECAPVRVIIPESDSAYWIRMVEKLEFIK